MKKAFSAACDDAKIVDLHFHDLRHTFGSRLAAKNVELVTIKDLIGHSSIKTTERYLHALNLNKHDAMKRLALFGKESSPISAPKEERLPLLTAVSA